MPFREISHTNLNEKKNTLFKIQFVKCREIKVTNLDILLNHERTRDCPFKPTKKSNNHMLENCEKYVSL